MQVMTVVERRMLDKCGVVAYFKVGVSSTGEVFVPCDLPKNIASEAKAKALDLQNQLTRGEKPLTNKEALAIVTANGFCEVIEVIG